MGGQRQRRRVEPDGDRRRARAGVSAGRNAHVRLLRRPSPRQQPLRREPRRRRSEDRRAQVALPARAPSALEHGHLDARRSSRTSPSTASRSRPCRCMGKQAMVYVFDRATGQPVWPIEETARAAERRARREVRRRRSRFPSKPPPYDHQGVMPDDAHRLHAGAARRGGEADVAATRSGPLFTPPVVSKAEGPLAGVPFVGRHELAGRRLRSRSAGALRAVLHVARARRAHAAAEQGVLRHPLRRRQRA